MLLDRPACFGPEANERLAAAGFAVDKVTGCNFCIVTDGGDGNDFFGCLSAEEDEQLVDVWIGQAAGTFIDG
jgi:hypothetical protein